MISATLDTNVLASGARKLDDPASTPGKILNRWIEGQFILVCSAQILDELERTLNKPYFRQHLTVEEIEQMLEMLSAESAMTELLVEVEGVASHPADDLILATAVSAQVDFLVTGDRALLRVRTYQDVKIVSPREFLDVLEEQRTSDP